MLKYIFLFSFCLAACQGNLVSINSSQQEEEHFDVNLLIDSILDQPQYFNTQIQALLKKDFMIAMEKEIVAWMDTTGIRTIEDLWSTSLPLAGAPPFDKALKENTWIVPLFRLFQEYQDSINVNKYDCINNSIEEYQVGTMMFVDLISGSFHELDGNNIMLLAEKMHHKNLENCKTISGSSDEIRLQNLLQEIRPYTTRKDIHYRIHLIEALESNAFAGIGGHIYVTTGLLRFVKSDDELAFIIAHEIGHLEKYHHKEKIQLMLLSIKMVGENIGSKISAAMIATLAPFERIHEYEADRIGASLAKKAGYNPSHGKEIFNRLHKFERQNLFKNLLRTHPYSIEREYCLSAFIKEQEGRINKMKDQ